MGRCLALLFLSSMLSFLIANCSSPEKKDPVEGVWKGTGKDRGTVITFDENGHYHLQKDGITLTGDTDSNNGEGPKMITKYRLDRSKEPGILSLISVKEGKDDKIIGKGRFSLHQSAQGDHPDTLLLNMNLGFNATPPKGLNPEDGGMVLYRREKKD